MTGKVKCGQCGEEIPRDRLLKHFGEEHGLDVMKYMKFWRTWRGLAWTFMVFSIGVILGILVGSLV